MWCKFQRKRMRTSLPSLWPMIALVLWVGCTPTKTLWRSEPEFRKTGNEYFDAKLSAYCEKTGCLGFSLFLENKSDKDIDIDWSRTAYLKNGVESGGFMFEGIILRDKRDYKPLETVVACGLLSKKIVPEILTTNKIVPERLTYTGKGPQSSMGPGEHGIRLVVKADGREISERLVINILKMEVPE
jgi:hypothetical protein